MAAYCQKKGLDQGSIRFLYEGQRVNDDDTPQGLDMEVRHAPCSGRPGMLAGS
jgi:small ubiquitin-related modifier